VISIHLLMHVNYICYLSDSTERYFIILQCDKKYKDLVRNFITKICELQGLERCFNISKFGSNNWSMNNTALGFYIKDAHCRKPSVRVLTLIHMDSIKDTVLKNTHDNQVTRQAMFI
jgi:hypothetical protein